MMAARRPTRKRPSSSAASASSSTRGATTTSAGVSASIPCPTLVACGRYDGIAPLANGEWIAAHVAGAELRVYEGGHVFFLQDPRALPEIGAFSSQIERYAFASSGPASTLPFWGVVVCIPAYAIVPPGACAAGAIAAPSKMPALGGNGTEAA